MDVVIPNIEAELLNTELSDQERLELYNLYEEVLMITAPFNFIAYNKYLELDEDHNDDNKAFYHHRRVHLAEVFEAFNDMEVYDKYDTLLISMPPRVGKTTTGIRFLSWIIGRYPEYTQLATSYSDAITKSFYNGTIEIVEGDRWKKVFPEAPLVKQNAQREEIWVKTVKRYPSIAYIPIGGSMTGRGEANNYLYCDDLVTGIEEAMSITRMEKLWELYSTNALQRKKDGAKEIHVATKWSVHDVITRLGREKADDPRTKVIDMSCYDENGESNFDFVGGFSTKYYNDIESTMNPLNFGALYKQQPIEREGLLYNDDELQYFMSLPNENPDTIIAVCDSKNLGVDYVSSPIGYVYGDKVFIQDVVFNNGLPDITRPRVANAWMEHKVIRADVELNNGGNYYAEDLDDIIRGNGGKTSIRIFYSGNNKRVKIITYSDYVKTTFIFRHPSTYSKHSEYAKFMENLLSWTQLGTSKHDDAPDSIAMLAQMHQELDGNAVKILNRRSLGL